MVVFPAMTGAARVLFISLSLLIGFMASTTALYLPPLQATGDLNWARAVVKGNRLLEQLQSGCYPDTINPIDLEGLRAIGFRIGDDERSRWPPNFQETSAFAAGQVTRFKWTARQKAYWRTSVDRLYYTPWRDETRYYNEYSPRNGLIAALAAKKAPGETLYWSDIAFAMWEAVTSFAGKNVKDLRFIAQQAIQHVFTQTIINRLVEGKLGEVRTFERGTEAFLALLGTPSGAGAVYLLMQHKRQLGRKTIVRATVFGKAQAQWAQHGPDVVFEIRDVADARIHGAASANATFSEHLASFCQSSSNLNNETASQL
ncbi:MAG: hypothetical protein L6R42_008231 [Xanthoria sp. 1 TBL-2021]|nr:MAG: hypothetical protein L6R42_008231 [Xanthoria sp. 1 TBL-2021]